MLWYAYLQHYQDLLEANEDENNYISLGSSILSLPEISSKILGNNESNNFKNIESILIFSFMLIYYSLSD